MSATYEQKRAELQAVAEGGTAGRKAYQEGRQRLMSDQRAAIDAALSGPVRFEPGTASALESIVAPVGETARARLDVAGERHGSSMGALDAALSGALATQGGARQLNYDRTLADSRLQTDRSIESGEIQRRKAAERAAAAEAERAAREAAKEASYSQSEEKMAAEALGGLLHDEDVTRLRAEQEKALSDELVTLGREAFKGLSPEQLSGLTRRMVMVRDDPAAVAELIAENSPAYAEEARSALTSGFDAIRNIGREVGGRAPVQRAAADPARQAALSNMLGNYGDLVPAQEAAYRKLETERYLANQDAYMDLFGDPLLAAGYFPRSFAPAEDLIDAATEMAQYESTGLYGADYDRWIKSQQEQARTEEEQIEIEIARDAGTNNSVVNGVIEALGADPQGVWDVLNSEDGAAVVIGALTKAAEAYSAGLSGADIKREATFAVEDAAENADLGAYGDVLAAIVREQYDAIYG